jgi:integrase/recombinase XerD
MAKLSVVKPAAPTRLERLVDDYLAACRAAGASPKTIRFGYGFPLKNVFLPWVVEQGITEASQLDNRVLDRFTVHLREEGGIRGPLSEQSIWTYMKAVNRFVRWLREEGEQVAAEGRKLPKLPKKLVEVLSREEVAQLEAAAQNERDKLIIRVLADGGLRVGELVKLRTTDLEEQHGSCFLKVRGKGNRERLVPVDRTLYRRLRRYAVARPGDSERIFVALRRGPGGDHPPLTENGVQQMVRELAEIAGLKRRVSPHTFRHSAATWMLRSGMNPLLVAQVLGHTSLDMIQNVYSHLTPTDAHRELIRALQADRESVT